MIISKTFSGLNMNALKYLLPLWISPLMGVTLRCTFAALAFWIIGMFTKPETSNRREKILLFLLGALGIYGFMFFYLLGLSKTTRYPDRIRRRIALHPDTEKRRPGFRCLHRKSALPAKFLSLCNLSDCKQPDIETCGSYDNAAIHLFRCGLLRHHRFWIYRIRNDTFHTPDPLETDGSLGIRPDFPDRYQLPVNTGRTKISENHTGGHLWLPDPDCGNHYLAGIRTRSLQLVPINSCPPDLFERLFR